MFNPMNLDEVCVQATHLEERGKNVQEEGTKKTERISFFTEKMLRRFPMFLLDKSPWLYTNANNFAALYLRG